MGPQTQGFAALRPGSACRGRMNPDRRVTADPSPAGIGSHGEADLLPAMRAVGRADPDSPKGGVPACRQAGCPRNEYSRGTRNRDNVALPSRSNPAGFPLRPDRPRGILHPSTHRYPGRTWFPRVDNTRR
jgi:hypothetical protein